MSCAELLAKINELAFAEKKGRSGTKGLDPRFRDYQGDDATHGPHIVSQQCSLATYLSFYVAKGCGDPPPGAKELSERPLPQPSPSLSPDAAKQIAQRVATGAAIATLGYFAYRAIRMLPSLFPPLWPTIPANLIVP